MKLSIITFEILCYLWNEPQEVIKDIEYLNHTLNAIKNQDINFNQEEKETAKEEIIELMKTL
jgi:uncharacterized protein YgfB (UPF0149 family)